MQIFENIADWLAFRGQLASKNRIGFVPTMGNLHAGHASLMQLSQANNDLTVVSIYINPTQFDESKDFNLYPRTLQEDLGLLEELKVDYCLLPSYADIYRDNFRFKISETELALIMEGEKRPGHFTGMLTVVMKLLNMVKPHNAYFGEKDYQQYLLIKGMVEAFFMDVKVHPCKTIREHSGLAMSSRNTRLTAKDRLLADIFAKIFHQAKSSDAIIEELTQAGIEIDYIFDWENRRFAAVKIGDVRLIDNYANMQI